MNAVQAAAPGLLASAVRRDAPFGDDRCRARRPAGWCPAGTARAVDGDGAQHRGCGRPRRADRARSTTTATNAATSPPRREHDLGGVAGAAAAGTPRRAHRRRPRRSTISIGRAAGRIRRCGGRACSSRRSFRDPQVPGQADRWWSRCASTAGLMTSSAGFGIHARAPAAARSSGATTTISRGTRSRMPVVAVLDRAGHHPLVQPQHVDRGQHQRGRREHREHRVAGERADQDQEFADERRQAGQRQRGQAATRNVPASTGATFCTPP